MRKIRFAAVLLATIIMIGASACSTQSDTQAPVSSSTSSLNAAESGVSGSSSASLDSIGNSRITSQPVSSSDKSTSSSSTPGVVGNTGASIKGSDTSKKAVTNNSGNSTGKSTSSGSTVHSGSTGSTGTVTTSSSKPASSKPTSSKTSGSTPTSSSKPASSSKPKTAYDKPYDIDQIRADMIAYGKSKGMFLKTSLWVKNEPPMYPSNCAYDPPTNTYEDIEPGAQFKNGIHEDFDYLLAHLKASDPSIKPSDIGFNIVFLPLAERPGDYFIFVLYG